MNRVSSYPRDTYTGAQVGRIEARSGRSWRRLVAATSLTILGLGLRVGVATARGADVSADLSRTVPGQVLVRFEDEVGRNEVETRLAALGVSAMEPSRVARGRFLRVKVSSADDVFPVLQALRAEPTVRWAEPNGLYRGFAPNDPECIDDADPEGNTFWDQWGYYRTNDDHAWDAKPHASEMELVRLAVLDSGVDFDHPDGAFELCAGAGCLWVNAEELLGTAGVDDDLNGYIDDVKGIDFVRSEQGTGEVAGYDGDPNVYAADADGSCGDGLDNDGNGLRDEFVYHGTHVAGIATALTNNNSMFAGHTWQTELMVVRVLSPEGWGTWADIAEGIEYAADNGAHVINLSLGGDFSQAVADACSYAHSLGCVIVAAAGNDGEGSVHYPARLPETIAVGASNPEDGRASFSNWGSEIDVVAPGVRIFANAVVSRWEGQGNGTTGDPTYYWANGTSQATPMVAALAANLRSLYGVAYENESVRCRIRDTARDLSGSWDGAGLIDALAATTPVPVGTCCLDDACIVSDEACCTAAGGTYLGEEPCDPGNCDAPSAVMAPLPEQPRVRLTPNPSAGRVGIEFQSDQAESLQLRVFDSSGRQVLENALGTHEPGRHRAEWDGRDQDGREVPNGRYYVRLSSPASVRTATIEVFRP